MPRNTIQPLGRRAFLQSGSLLLAATALDPAAAARLLADESRDDCLRFGLVTDMHYADKPPAGSRHYRETLAKLAEAAEHWRKQSPAFVVELGDFIDAADSVETELRYLARIEREFASVCAERHYVLGNHCVDTLTKEEFLGGVEQAKSYYSFDRGGYHFIVLDSCFRSDGAPYQRRNFAWTDPNVPARELEWLQADLQANRLPVVLFAHQRLDVDNQYAVKNAADVRKALVEAGNVLAVFQGHSHKNDYRELDGIHYCTQVAMVEGSGLENSGYATVELRTDRSLRVDGFRKQQSYTWGSPDG